MPKISCIMPVYNTAKYLDECIQSILNQTFTDFEFIISDDWSTDWSKDIIKKYAQNDNRIIFLDNPKNRWIVDNLNDCINNASWEYIAIMESDDISLPERFEIELNEFDKDNELMLVWTQWYLINSIWKIWWKFNKPINDNEIKKNIWIEQPFLNPSIMFKKIIINEIWMFDKYFNFIQDYDFIFKVVNKFKTKNINKYLIKYRVHNNNSSIKKWIFLVKKQREIKIKNFYLIKWNFYLKILIELFFIKNLSLSYITILTQKIWIYKIIAPIYRKLFIK